MPDFDNLTAERVLFSPRGIPEGGPHVTPAHSVLGPIFLRCKVIDLAAITAPGVSMITVLDWTPKPDELLLITGAFLLINYTNASGTIFRMSLGTGASTNADDLIKELLVEPRPAPQWAGLNVAAHNNAGNLLYDSVESNAMRPVAMSALDVSPSSAVENGFRKASSNIVRLRVSRVNTSPLQGKVRPFLQAIPFLLDD